MDHIYNLYGDESYWQRIISDFYDEALTDPLIASFFVGKDVSRIKSMHNALLSAALQRDGGHFPVSVVRVHKALGITEEIFNRYVYYYKKSLKEHGISKNDIETISNIILAFKSDLVID